MSESDDEYDGVGDYTARPATCSACSKQIGFKNRRPYDVKFVSENVYRITDSPHNATCPVKIRERIKSHCPFCQFEEGRSILSIRGLFGYETCEKHEEIYNENMKRKKRLARRSLKPQGNEGMEVFL
jgi:hypothetical protein